MNMKLMMSLCTKGFYRECTTNPPWTMKHCMMSSFVNTIFKLITKFGVIWQSSLKEEGQSSDIIQDRATKIRGAGLGWIYGDGSDNYCTRVRFHTSHWTGPPPCLSPSNIHHTYNLSPLTKVMMVMTIAIHLGGRLIRWVGPTRNRVIRICVGGGWSPHIVFHERETQWRPEGAFGTQRTRK